MNIATVTVSEVLGAEYGQYQRQIPGIILSIRSFLPEFKHIRCFLELS